MKKVTSFFAQKTRQTTFVRRELLNRQINMKHSRLFFGNYMNLVGQNTFEKDHVAFQRSYSSGFLSNFFFRVSLIPLRPFVYIVQITSFIEVKCDTISPTVRENVKIVFSCGGFRNGKKCRLRVLREWIIRFKTPVIKNHYLPDVPAMVHTATLNSFFIFPVV